MTASEEELTSVLLKLNDEGIDIHIHVVCDRAFRTCCNAVENAKKICGEKWGIYVTLAHCELIHPDDMKRVAELGIFIRLDCSLVRRLFRRKRHRIFGAPKMGNYV